MTHDTIKTDFLVIGGGIAGVSAAYHLAAEGHAIVLETEDVCGHHSTGRSAAIFSEHHGPEIICDLALASKSFFENPYDGFTETPFLSKRGVIFTGDASQQDAMDKMLAGSRDGDGALREISSDEVKALVPVINQDVIARGIYYEGGREIDVHAVHQGWIRGLKKRGGEVHTSQELLSASFENDVWTVKTRNKTYEANYIINASGAWADVIAERCGMQKVGLVPKKRTVITVPVSDDYDDYHWPMVIFTDGKLYFKSEKGAIMASPMDETVVEPMDAWADDMDMAVTADLVEKRTNIDVTKLINHWAGLRSFVFDDIPVVGPTPDNDRFIWLAGQGGYGIKTCDAMGRIATALTLGRDLPDDVKKLGITKESLGAERCIKHLKEAV